MKVTDLPKIEVNSYGFGQFDFCTSSFYSNSGGYCDEPLLEYMIKVANELYRPIKKDDNYMLVPEDKQGGISKDPNCFGDRFHKGIFKDARLAEYEADKKLDETLTEVYGIDVSKFWYLCLYLKDYVCDRIQNKVVAHSPKQDLEDLLSAIDESIDLSVSNAIEERRAERNKAKNNIEHLFLSNMPIHLKGTAKLTFQVGSKNSLVLSDPMTLFALAKLLEKGLNDTNWIDQSFIDCKGDKSLPTSYGLYLFREYLTTFLKNYDAKSVYKVSANKDLIVSKMAYYTGLSEKEDYAKDYFNTETNPRKQNTLLKDDIKFILKSKSYQNKIYQTYNSIYGL